MICCEEEEKEEGLCVSIISGSITGRGYRIRDRLCTSKSIRFGEDSASASAAMHQKMRHILQTL